MRLVNAILALAALAACYFLYRTISSYRRLSVIATVCVAANHVLLALSRMAMRDNTAMLVEALALALLFRGLKRSCVFHLYLGGLACGLGFYVYYPARAILALWLMYLVVLVAFLPKKFNWRALFVPALVPVVVVALMVWPLAVQGIKQPDRQREAIEYQRRQCLLFAEGRDEQKVWTNCHSVQEGIAINLRNGLTLFNNTESDKAYIYDNLHHGFMDPVSGMPLWIGLIVIMIRFRSDTGSLLMVSSLLLEWTVFSVIVNKCPSYPRQLVLLPFAGFCIAHAVIRMSEMVKTLCLRKFPRAQNVSALSCVVLLLPVVAGNWVIYGDYLHNGFAPKSDAQPTDLGSTARYIAAREGQPNYNYILVADSQYPYFSYGPPEWWRDWLESTTRITLRLKIIPAKEIDACVLQPP
ncbi:MAG: phospholipid carrier-dependent glycosyltransferase, partial [Terriglobales bacterium]